MCKKFFSFAEVDLHVGFFKPEGTKGLHHMTIIHQDNGSLVVVGSLEGYVVLKKDDKLGYAQGKIWRVRGPSSFKDPVRRVLAQAGIPQKALQYSNDPVRYTQSWKRIRWSSGADVESGESITVDGIYTHHVISNLRYPNEQEYMGGSTSTYDVEAGNVIVVKQVYGYEETTFCQKRRVSRVIVRKSADKSKVVTFLEKLFDVGNYHENRIQAERNEAQQFEADLEKAKNLFRLLAKEFNKEALVSFLNRRATFKPVTEDQKGISDCVRSFFVYDTIDAGLELPMLMFYNNFEHWYIEQCEPGKSAIVLDNVGYRVSLKGWYLPNDMKAMFSSLDHVNAGAERFPNETLVGLYRTGILQKWVIFYSSEEIEAT